MKVLLIDGTVHQLEDLILFAGDAVCCPATASNWAEKLRGIDEDVLIVNHGTRFLDQFPKFSGSEIQVPTYVPINMFFAERLPLPKFNYGLRPNYQFSRHFGEPYSASSACVFIPRRYVPQINTKYESIDAAIVELCYENVISQAETEVYVNAILPQIGQADVEKLSRVIPKFPIDGRRSMLEMSAPLRNALMLNAEKMDAVIIRGKFPYNKAMVKAFQLVIAVGNPQCEEAYALVTTSNEVPAREDMNVWSVDGALDIQKYKNFGAAYGRHLVLYEPSFGDSLDGAFLCSSPEILAVHLLAHARAASIALYGDFNNIPFFWENVHYIKAKYGVTITTIATV